MSHRTYPKRDPSKNYFKLPNELYLLGLKPTGVAIYAYLMRIEDRETFECYASYKTIGKAVGVSPNTVRKYVAMLEERGLITTEHTTVTLKGGTKRNGTLKYRIRPIQEALDLFYEQQMTIAEEMAERQRVAELQAKMPPVCPPDAACAIFEDAADTQTAEGF